ncbi:MAG: DUF1223 domain-containing protein [Rhodobacterales bacterium]|nr:DUF1223 domain-containing protein [Rhodobacterales bacterium]
MTRHTRIALPALIATALLALTTSARAGDRLTVVELFTSQGCSSCPPADTFLGELSQRQDILALSMHVDYWDYIGWKDPFALPANSERQRTYAHHFGLRYVYTPQMVVQGQRQATGSDRDRVLNSISALADEPTLDLSGHRAADDPGVMVVDLPESPGTDAVVLAVGFDNAHETRIKRGENRDRTLRYHNVVRAVTEVGTWDGHATRLRLSLGDVAPQTDACAVLVQSRRSGRILGAVRMNLGG